MKKAGCAADCSFKAQKVPLDRWKNWSVCTFLHSANSEDVHVRDGALEAVRNLFGPLKRTRFFLLSRGISEADFPILRYAAGEALIPESSFVLS